MLQVRMFVQSSASRTQKRPTRSLPALKRWAIVIQSASRTKKVLCSKPGPDCQT